MNEWRKGISSVLSNVLLILITVIGMTILFSFTTYYFTDFQSRQGSAIMEGIVLDDTWVKDDIGFPEGVSQGVILNLYNFGKINFSITQIFVDGIPVDFYTLNDQNGEPVDVDNINTGTISQSDSLEIKMGDHGGLILNMDASAGVEYNIKIFTERNSKLEFKIRRE